jgi:hypothetical protein
VNAGPPPFDPLGILPRCNAAVAHAPATCAPHGGPLLMGGDLGAADGGEWGARWAGGIGDAVEMERIGAGDDPFHADWRHWAGR